MLLDVTIQVDSDALGEYARLAEMASMTFSEYANKALASTLEAEPFATEEEAADFVTAGLRRAIDEAW